MCNTYKVLPGQNVTVRETSFPEQLRFHVESGGYVCITNSKIGAAPLRGRWRLLLAFLRGYATVPTFDGPAIYFEK